MTQRKPLTPDSVQDHRLSHSQLQTFQGCEKRWEYIYVHDLVPKRSKAYFVKGTLIHECLGEYYRFLTATGLRPGHEAAVDHVIEFITKELEFMDPTPDNVKVHKEVLQCVLRYMRDFSPTADRRMKVLDVEREIEIELITPQGRLVRLLMVLDLLMQVDGHKWVVDHKSSGQGGVGWSENELIMDTQMPTYLAGLREIGVKVHGAMINNLNTYDYKNYLLEPVEKLFKRQETYRTDKELDFALRQYGLMADAVLGKVEQGDEFLRKMSKDCAKCPFMDLCMFDMKGIPTGILLEESFVRRTKPTQPELSNDIGETQGQPTEETDIG